MSEWLDRAQAAEDCAIGLAKTAAEYEAQGNHPAAARLRDDASWWLDRSRGYRKQHAELIGRLAREVA